MDTEDPFEVRIGTFFIVMGGGIFLLFIVSDVADQVDFDYFFISLILFVVGYYLRRSKAPPPSAGRFSAFNNFMEKMRSGRKSSTSKDKKDKR